MLINKFVQRSQEEDAERPDKKYGYIEHRDTEKFDESGNVLNHNDQTFRLVLINGNPLEKLIEVSGKPLSIDDAPDKLQKPQQQVTLKLDDQFMSHFQFGLVGSEQLNGRLAYIITMLPKLSYAPIRSNNEQVFVHMQGKVWVDASDFSLVKCDLTLSEAINFYFGIGCVRKLKLFIQRRLVDPKVWVPERVSYYIDYRELFLNTRERKESSYSHFCKLIN